MKLLETKKLHYNKYLYKIAIRNQCASFFRTEFQKGVQLSYAKKRIDECHQWYDVKHPSIDIPWGNKYVNRIPREHYWDAISIYRHLKNQEGYIVRCELNCLNIYSNDRNFLIKLNNKLKNSYIEFYEPDPEKVDLLLNDKNVILVNKLPKYEYKITLGRKKGSASLAEWIDTNPHLAKMGDTAKQECYNQGYVKGYYFFVSNKKSLLIAQMMVGENIQRIDHLVYTDK
jgi:hypothetical protein|tara:strand:+ start:1607 stop:2293 length:687 start_codon:yes stop_codon:yes gene_type:complete